MFVCCVSCIIRSCITCTKKNIMHLSQVERIACGSDIKTVIDRGGFKALRTVQTHRDEHFGETAKSY